MNTLPSTRSRRDLGVSLFVPSPQTTYHYSQDLLILDLIISGNHRLGFVIQHCICMHGPLYAGTHHHVRNPELGKRRLTFMPRAFVSGASQQKAKVAFLGNGQRHARVYGVPAVAVCRSLLGYGATLRRSGSLGVAIARSRQDFRQHRVEWWQNKDRV